MKKSKLVFILSLAVGIMGLCLFVCYGLVSWNASGRTYDDIKDIPYNKYALLLATSPITPGGAQNFYFDNRIKAADELYKAGKIDYIIASGGDYTQDHKFGCNEPVAIRDSLVEHGIPIDRIILDFDGPRTLNSIVKTKEVYKLDSVTLISQKYHNERAIYLSDKNGIYAIGYNAKQSHIRRNRIKNTVREIFARPKMFIDFVIGEKPEIKEANFTNQEI